MCTSALDEEGMKEEERMNKWMRDKTNSLLFEMCKRRIERCSLILQVIMLYIK